MQCSSIFPSFTSLDHVPRLRWTWRRPSEPSSDRLACADLLISACRPVFLVSCGVMGGFLLEDLTWIEAERRLTPEAVIVIPIGAAAKEHGPHLLLKNDFTLAEYFKRRVLEAADVVIAPTVGYHFYPAFVEYPGSISLRFGTARDLMVDIVKSL